MARTVGIGIQDFEKVITNECFYVDKTDFIREWWESKDDVTLITRPRRFGKTLNMSMLEKFFSLDYAGRGDLFEGLSIWKNEKYRSIQGTYPVISLSFANVKERNFEATKERIGQLITELYSKHQYLLSCEWMSETDKEFFLSVRSGMPEVVETLAINKLSGYLSRYYGKKVIILLDEYDTPMQEAYVDGFWEDMTAFIRSLFNATFKTNPWMERGMMTGITRVSKESVFSDLNNLEVVTTTSEKYATAFGFTEQEVFTALEECDLKNEKEQVKRWYDGFIFGNQRDIYNPWSILNFLGTGKIKPYWANTSSNSLAGKLIREGGRNIKEKFERLLRGESLISYIDEQIVYNQLDGNERAIWSLFLASGYLKVLSYESYQDIPEGTLPRYELALTNFEVKIMFQKMVHDWFTPAEADYNDFIKALLLDDVKAMNAYMNRIAVSVFSYFDTGNGPSKSEPERFYHGFVLGLMVELQNRFIITSNRESGFGRYDVMLEPKSPKEDDAMILEFKVQDEEDEKTLKDTVNSALRQIEEKQYATQLISKGIPKDCIRSYGFAFRGKQILIGKS
ncbi:MAG: AAA family ATPase [Bariatricus sp.]|nr:AAA family ATPase [Bariatricus sp.]